MKSSDVVILGAGLAGLGCARSLPGARVFEAADHPGGHVYSHDLEGVFFDEGAHICHAKDPAWLQLLYAQAGEVERIQPSIIRNHWDGNWHTYPVQNHLRDLEPEDRVRALTEIIQGQIAPPVSPPAHYLAWCRSQYGDFLTEKFYAKYTAKYWRVPMEELATDWLSGRLLPSQIPRIVRGAFIDHDDDQSVFSLFHYPARGGFFSFFKTLYRGLPITYEAPAVQVDARRREVVFANGRREAYAALASSIPLNDLVAMIAEAPAEVREAARKLRDTQLLCVNLLVNRADLSDCHWFYLYDADIEVSRVKVMSNVAPRAVPPGCTALQCEIFRRQDEPVERDRLVDHTIEAMGRLLGFERRDVRAAAAVHARHAYVISDLHRAPAVAAILPWLEERAIFPMGLFGRWQFIWSDAAYRSGIETGDMLAAGR